MSWGTARARDAPRARRTDAQAVAVLGCGAVGLATARLLQLRGAASPSTRPRCRPTPRRTSPARSGSPSTPTAAARSPAPSASSSSPPRASLSLVPVAGRRRLRRALDDQLPLATRRSPRRWRCSACDSPIRELIPELTDLPRDAHPFAAAVRAPLRHHDDRAAGLPERAAARRSPRGRQHRRAPFESAAELASLPERDHHQLHRARRARPLRRRGADADQRAAHGALAAAGGRLRGRSTDTSTCSRAATACCSAAPTKRASSRSSPTAAKARILDGHARLSRRSSPTRPVILPTHDASPLARAWLDAFNAHDVDALVALYAEDATHTSPKIRALHPDTGGKLVGKPALAAWWRDANRRLPGLRYEADRHRRRRARARSSSTCATRRTSRRCPSPRPSTCATAKSSPRASITAETV